MPPRDTHHANVQAQFDALLGELAHPQAIPPGARGGGAIELRQAHASGVLLTDTHAFKIKKPLDLGFLDYSTPALRRACCVEECEINQPLAPDVYLGVAPVLRGAGGAHFFGAIVGANKAPMPGASSEGREVVDFAVVMRRLPDTRSLASLLSARQVDAALLQSVATTLARFHNASDVAFASSAHSPVTDALGNMRQTVKQAAVDIGKALAADEHAAVKRFVKRFSVRRRPLLEARLRAGRVRNGHGDVRLEHIYVNPWGEPPNAGHPEIFLVDRIEFDSRFRIGDVAGDVAFLEVELEAAGRADLARAFTRAYIEASGDTGLLEIAPLYRVYRALVRGTVRARYMTQQRSAAAYEEARTFYEMAARYATAPDTASVVMIGGLMGGGKSTLARTLSTELGWAAYSSDVTRKQLAGLPVTAPISASDRRALYTPAWDRRVYHQLAKDMATCLASGRSVILDASFLTRARRRLFTEQATAAGARAFFIECVCPRDVALARIQARWDTKSNSSDAQDNPVLASDGRSELYDAQARRWEAFSESAASYLLHAIIDTTTSRPRQLEAALQALGIPRSVCFLG